MSLFKTEEFKTKDELRAIGLQKASEIAEAAKKKAIKDANAQMGLCGVIAIALVISAIAVSGLGVFSVIALVL